MSEELHVRLIGVPTIESSRGEVIDVRGQKPWAVLARILLADRPVTRRELSTALFAEAADPLGALRWCLASLRKSLHSAEVFVGDPISRNLPAGVTVDVLDLGTVEVDRLSAGELLEGVDLSYGPEFDTWLLVKRRQVAASVDARLREATITALSRGNHELALSLAEAAARRSPFDEGPQVLLVKALAMAGHADAAVRHVEGVEARFRRELGCEPSPALRSAARPSVAAPPPGISADTIARSLVESGLAAIAAGAIDAGIDCLRRAGAQAESTGDDALMGRCWFELGSALVHSIRGFDDEGSVLLEQAVQRSRAAGDLPTNVAALRERGYADTLAGRRPEADAHLIEAASLAGGDATMLAPVLAVSALNQADWGRPEPALELFESTVELARSTGDRRWEGWALGLGGWAALSAGRVAQAIEWSDACSTVVRDLQWRSFAPWPSTVAAEARMLGGSSPPTPDDLERCFAISCELEDPCWEGASGRVLALARARAGDVEGALDWIVRARARAARKSDTWVAMIGEILLVESEIRRALGDDTGADAAARELVGLAARAHLDAQLSRAVLMLQSSAHQPTERARRPGVGKA